MAVDKDKPHTWVKYRSRDCKQCMGSCCTMPVEIKIMDLLRLGVIGVDDLHLNPRKLTTRLKRQGIIQSYRDSTKLFMLTQRPNGDCLFLHPQTRMCTAYHRRPEVCRLFPEQMGLRPGYCPKIEKERHAPTPNPTPIRALTLKGYL